jgi:hypothetical protein
MMLGDCPAAPMFAAADHPRWGIPGTYTDR